MVLVRSHIPVILDCQNKDRGQLIIDSPAVETSVISFAHSAFEGPEALGDHGAWAEYGFLGRQLQHTLEYSALVALILIRGR